MELKHCKTCGKILNYLSESQRQNKLFCSWDCYLAGNSPVAIAAHREKMDIRDYIVKVLNETGSYKVAAHTMGISVDNLYKWISKLEIIKRWA